MNPLFRPFLSKQREQREAITQQTKQITTLVTQLHAAQTQLGHVQENLKNCMTYLEETVWPAMETLKRTEADNVTLRGQVADRDEKITKLEADLKAAKSHKKKPTTAETVS